MQAAKMEARSKLYSGSTANREDQFMWDVQKWASGHAIWAIGSEAEISSLLPGVPEREITIVKRIETPKPPADDRGRDGGFGRGGFGRGFGGGGGGMFGPGIAPGETIVIAKWSRG